VHRHLGPGLHESTYEQCLAHELHLPKIPCKVQAPLPVYYKKINLDCGYRVDLFVDDFIVLELKAVEHVLPIHHAPLLTYMKPAETPIGLLLNFNTPHLRHGIVRVVNSLPPSRPSRPSR
jgi:GxxExxY protein